MLLLKYFDCTIFILSFWDVNFESNGKWFIMINLITRVTESGLL